MWFLAFTLEDVVQMILNALRGLFAYLCKIIYPGIAKLYDIFIELGSYFYDPGISSIYDRIRLIIGIFMVFRVIFWLIEALVNPDITRDKEKNPKKIIFKVVLSAVLLVITPTLFEKAFEIQSIIMDNHIIEHVIIGDDNIIEETSVGRYLAAEVFVNFYTPAVYKDDYNNSVILTTSSNCIDLYTAYNSDGTLKSDDPNNDDITSKGNMYLELYRYGTLNSLTNSCLSLKAPLPTDSSEKDYVIDFNGLFATAVGVFIFWMLLMYCISLGTRYVQLIYLQIIAPIPIMCNLAPGKDNMFNKWVKQCTVTYLDLFIRVAVINFVMLLCCILLKNNSGVVADINSLASSASGYIKIFLILGLLTFAKKAPELIQELLPKGLTKASGDFGLSLKKRTDAMLGGKYVYGTLKRAPGYVAGGVIGAGVGGALGAIGGKGVGSRLAGFFSGASRGFSTGSKKGNILKNVGEVRKNQAAQNSKLQQWRVEAGKSEDEPNNARDWISRKLDAGKKSMGFETRSQYLDRAKQSAQSVSSVFKDQKEEGITKVLENGTKRDGTRASSLGIGGTLLERDQRRKTAEAALKENDKSSLLSTADGNTKLETFLNSAAGMSWATANGVTSTTLTGLTGTQKDSLADSFIANLQEEANVADQDYRDSEKQFSFIYAVEQAAGIVRDVATGDITNIDSSKANEKNVNNWSTINDFISEYDELYGLTTGDNPVLSNRTKKFDPVEMARLVRRAESGDNGAKASLEKIYKDYDKIKTLMSRVDTVERQNAVSRANDKYNG